MAFCSAGAYRVGCVPVTAVHEPADNRPSTIATTALSSNVIAIAATTATATALLCCAYRQTHKSSVEVVEVV